MGVVQDAINSLEGYLVSLTRNTEKGWYELEVGLSTKWVYDENKEIKCEVVDENEEYRLLKIIPKNTKVTIDDLINYFEIVVGTNEKIAQKEEEFKKRMEKIKEELEGEAKKFYEELDSLKENSFKNVNTKFEKKLQESKQMDSEKKRGRGRPSKSEKTISPSGTVVISNSEENIEDYDGKESNLT